MKTTNLVGKFATLATITVLGFVTSCNKDNEPVSAQDVSDASSESVSDSYYQDSDDMSLYALQNNSPGRISTDSRICDGDVSFEANSTTTSGTMYINFGTDAGCTDSYGNVRKGKITLTYSNGPVGNVGFTVVETFDNYTINGIKLEGTRTIVRQESASESIIIHSINLENGKAIWPDLSFATRTSSFTRTVDLSGDGTITLTGSASGESRSKKSYAMTIQTPIVHKGTCALQGIFMAVQGVKTFTVDGTKNITLDYGDGTCDKIVSITINGHTKSVTVGKV